jgi:hypothetical protein
VSARDVYVDPSRLLVVSYEEDQGDVVDLLAVTARYVPATLPSGKRRVVMQLVYDGSQKQPLTAYYCPRDRLRTLLVVPGRIRGIRAYER